MKNTSKILALVLVLMTVLMSFSVFTVGAVKTTEPTMVYLTPNNNWKTDNPRYAIYTWDGGDKWFNMSDPDGDGTYECELPAGIENIIFCRMSPSAAANNWTNKWNQSSDLKYDGVNNHYTVSEGAWDKGAGTWGVYVPPQVGHECVLVEDTSKYVAPTCTTEGLKVEDCTAAGCDNPHRETKLAPLGHKYASNAVCSVCSSAAEYYVVGTLVNDWEPGNKAYPMTRGEDGIYTLVIENVKNSATPYEFKIARDGAWGDGQYPTDMNNLKVTVSVAGSTVTVTFNPAKPADTKAEAVAPHVCEFSDPTCTEPGKCSCDKTQGEPTGHKIEGRACANGCGLSLDTLNFWVSDSSVYTVEGLNIKYNGATTHYPCVGSADAALFAAGHNTLTITITNNGSADSRVRVDVQGTTDVGNHKVLNTHAVGGDVWTDMEWGGSAVTVPAGESVTLTITYDESTDRGTVTNLIVFVDSCRGDGQTYNSDITLSDITFSTVEPEVPHVNTLVVGDTNKIVVDGDFFNDYGLPIEWVLFTAEENGFYTFTGDNGALAFIFTPEYGLVSATGAANLEAGNYLICLGNGFEGEFNVAVTKAPWVNALAVGAGNKILITDAQDNGYGYYITWVTFEVTEKANYTFTGEGILALVYDSAYAAVTGTELEPGTYNICVAFMAPATTGVASVDVTKTAISDGGDDPVDTPTDPALQVGENTVTIDGTTTNYIGNAVAWLTFTPETSGTYTFASEELTAYIYAERNMGATALGTGVAELEAGVTYYVLVGKGGVTGEFVVTVSAGGEVVAPNTIVVGENHYVISDALYAVGFEFLELTVTEPGVYKVSGGAPMKVYLFTLPNVDLGTAGAGAFGWNVDAMEDDGFADYFYVTLPEAGTYWFGVNYEYVTDVREFDITIELHTEHEYVEGKCECGAQEPVQEPDQPEQPGGDEPTDEPTTPAPELTLWDKIVAFIKRILAMILGFFKK